MSRKARIIFGVILVAAVTAAAGALVWRSSTPAAATTSDLRQTILRYELADAVYWPEGAYGRTRLKPDEEEAMQTRYDDALRASATGAALRNGLALQPWRSLQKRRSTYPRMLTTGSGGRIVYYDFVRRTISGDLVVRALVQRYMDKAAWYFRTQKLKRLGRDWWPTGLVIEYRLTKTGAGWRITAGEALPLQYDVKTGELTHGWP